MTMELDLRGQEGTLPAGIAKGVTALHACSLADLKIYCQCFAVDLGKLNVICLAEGHGDIAAKARWATEIAAHFDATVHFSHNETELVAFPSTYKAVIDMWDCERVKEVDRAYD